MRIGSLWKEERGERVPGSLGVVVVPIRRLLLTSYCIRLNGSCMRTARDKIEIVGRVQDSLSGMQFGVRGIAVLGAAAGVEVFNLNMWGYTTPQHQYHLCFHAQLMRKYAGFTFIIHHT